jgi:N,N-dimethylformamidase
MLQREDRSLRRAGLALDRTALDAIRRGARPDPAGVLADWDTSAGYSEYGIGDGVVDTGPYELHAEGYNRPVRGLTGWNWSGRNDSFRLAPREYGGIELHADALIDCYWEPTLALTIPDHLKSGVYAIKLTAGDAEEYTPFFVRPAAPRAATCLLIPTASYLAYANVSTAFDGTLLQAITASTPIFQELDLEVPKNDVAVGLSSFDSTATAQAYATPPTAVRSSTSGRNIARRGSARRGSFRPTCRSSPGWRQ